MRFDIRRILPWIFATAFLLSISLLGTYNGIGELRDGDATTVLQKSVSIGSLIYGLVGIAAAGGVLLRRRWGYFLSLAWGVVITYTGAMASHAYGETTAPGTAIAALITALIAGFVIWLAGLATRRS